METTRRLVRQSALLLTVGSASLLLPGALRAQTTITIDGSWGRTPAALTPSASATTVTGNLGSYPISGNVYTIPQEMGKAAGTNLFHSFQAFSVGAGDAAVFTTTTPTLTNVISRVSGSTATQINGLLALLPLNGGAPNFFFINPAGVTFGAGAQVDVPGAFHVSTAHGLHMGSTVFKAGSGPDSTLTIAPPDAFGFLGTKRASIAVVEGATLSPAPGQSLSVAAGDVLISQGVLSTDGGGDIRVIAVGSDAVEIELVGVVPAVNGALDIVNGGSIQTTTSATQSAGDIAISVGDFTMEGGATFARISSTALPGASGNAGNVAVAAAGQLSLASGVLSSDSYHTGSAGSITVSAASMVLDGQGVAVGLDLLDNVVQTGISTSTYALGTFGRAGSVTLDVRGSLSILNGARVFSRTVGQEKAGPIRLTAGRLVSDAWTSPYSTGIYSVALGSSGGGADVDAAVTREVSLVNGAALASVAFAGGDTGSIRVAAANMTIDPGEAGFFTGITTQTSRASSGAAGDIVVELAEDLSIVRGALVSSSTSGSGAAGSIRIGAANFTLDGRGAQFNTGITSRALPGSGGPSGMVEVSVGTSLTVLNGAQIASTTSSLGDAGTIRVTAGTALIDGRDNGVVDTGIIAATGPGSAGRAGSVELSVAKDLWVVRGGVIVSATNSTGDAASVKVIAGDITIDSQGSMLTGILSTAALGPGDGGDIQLHARGGLSVIGASVIASSSIGTGKAGSIALRAQDIRIDALGDREAPGVQASVGGNAGDAGDIVVTAARSLSLVRAGSITAVTFSPRGRSGSVTVEAQTVSLDGAFSHISADAEDASSGQTGNLTVNVTNAITLSNGARLSIRNDATVANPGNLVPTLLTISAPSIVLKDAEISARSSGNVAASNVAISFTDRMFLDPSGITTSANLGDGGDIDIAGSGLLWLDHSQITTSTIAGNGGDIRIRAGILLLETGFIQANTGGVGASGGNVSIAVQALLSSGNTLSVADPALVGFQADAFGFNLIQAAAPSGVSGAIGLSAPVVDIAGELSGLEAQMMETGPLGRDLCRVGAGSSLTPVGRGGPRPGAAGLIRPERLPAVDGAQAAAVRPEVVARVSYECR